MSVEPGSHELSAATFGYTLFTILALSTWCIVGSFMHGTLYAPSTVGTIMHRVTPLLVCMLSTITIVLLFIDFY